ncbi:MAG: hypothetical protein J6C05_03195 [Prevotella sp.]|nr:hypothetical protein [Prevotella sp.]MBO5156123.1 hypothetical protein [Prevotella sp.]
MRNINEQTVQQLERALRKIADKFPDKEEANLLTDIHVRVSQESGELMAFDDDDHEITRVVIESWIDNKDEDFYDMATTALRQVMHNNSKLIDGMALLKPFSFVLEDDEREDIAELYIADDDTVIVDTELMPHLSEDLDEFFENLMKE